MRYENAGVRAEWWFAVLELGSYREVSGSEGVSFFRLVPFLILEGPLRLDFVKLTRHALDVPRKRKEGLNGPPAHSGALPTAQLTGPEFETPKP